MYTPWFHYLFDISNQDGNGCNTVNVGYRLPTLTHWSILSEISKTEMSTLYKTFTWIFFQITK